MMMQSFSIEKIECIRECPVKYWYMFVSDFSDKMFDIRSELTRIITRALVLGDKKQIEPGLEKIVPQLPYAMDLLIGMNNLYDRVQNFVRKLPEAVLLPNLKFGVDLDNTLYDGYDPRAYFQVSYDITIEYTVPDLTPRRKAYKVIDFGTGKIYQGKADTILDLKAACLKLARGAGVYCIEYQIALVTEAWATYDIVLTPIKKRAVRHMSANILRDYVKENEHLLVSAQTLVEKKYFSNKCTVCAFNKYCQR
jgi:CRISPR/Cas system-associated exonuclease Cas4 (RecB family)